MVLYLSANYLEHHRIYGIFDRKVSHGGVDWIDHPFANMTSMLVLLNPWFGR
jgi:hypothetical protein